MPGTVSIVMPSTARRGEAGMTLLEVMIATLVLSFAVIGTFSTMNTSHAVSKNATARSRVLEQVQRTVEEIQNTSFGTYSATTFVVDGVEPPAGRAAVGSISKFLDIAGRKIGYAIEAKWKDESGDQTVVITYVHSYRGY